MASLNFIPGNTLLIETIYTRDRITRQAVRRYIANTLSTRASYSFSPMLFLNTFVQYNGDRKVATVNFLFWYIYKPGSDFYIVYDSGWNTGLPGGRSHGLKNRSLAIKMTYWVGR